MKQPVQQNDTTKILPEHEKASDTFHIFMLVKTTRHWLDMPTPKRMEFFKSEIFPLLKARPEIKMRYFEPESFATRVSDILIWETKDLSAWIWLCDQLRDTLFWDHYFEIIEILPSIEADYPAMIANA